MPILPGEKKNRNITILTIIVALISLFGIIFPVFHFYDYIMNPSITTTNGIVNVSYHMNNSHNLDANGNIFTFSTNPSVANVSDNGAPNSSLTVQLVNGELYYDSAINGVRIYCNLSVVGKFTTNLDPKSLSLSYSATGLSSQAGLGEDTWAPPYSTWIPSAQNLSPNDLGKLAHSGLGSVSVTTNLHNENKKMEFYNFSVSVYMDIQLNWYNNSTHVFVIGAEVNGLSKTVRAEVAMSITEMKVI